MLNVGDRIFCKDEDDLIDTMKGLAKAGVQTDFCYLENDVVCLEVEKIETE